MLILSKEREPSPSMIKQSTKDKIGITLIIIGMLASVGMVAIAVIVSIVFNAVILWFVMPIVMLMIISVVIDFTKMTKEGL